MNKLAIIAISSIALPLMTSQASAMWICQYFDNPTPSGRYDGNEVSYKLAAEVGTDIEADNVNYEADARVVHATLGGPINFFEDGAIQVFGLGSGISSENWSLRDHMSSVNIGQKNLNRFGGHHSFGIGQMQVDWNSGFGGRDIDGTFYQLDGSCFIGNDLIVRGVIGTMDKNDGVTETDVDYYGTSLDYFLDDYNKITFNYSYADSDDLTPKDARQFGVGFRSQINPNFPVLVGFDINHAEVDDGTLTQGVTTFMVSVALMGIGNNTEIVPTQREFEHHSTHYYGWPVNPANLVD